MARPRSGALPTEDVTHNITPNFMKAHLRRMKWQVLTFDRMTRCIDPLNPKWAGTVWDAYVRQMGRESTGDQTTKLSRTERRGRF